MGEPLLPEVVPDRVPEVQLCVARGGSVCQNGVRVRKREPLLALWVKRGPNRLNPNLWVMERHEVRSEDETREEKLTCGSLMNLAQRSEILRDTAKSSSFPADSISPNTKGSSAPWPTFPRQTLE